MHRGSYLQGKTQSEGYNHSCSSFQRWARFFHTLCSSCTGKYFLGLTQSSLLTCIPRICTNPAPCKKASGTSKQGMALLYPYTPQPPYLMNCLIIVGQEIEYTGDSLVSSKDGLNIERTLS